MTPRPDPRRITDLRAIIAEFLKTRLDGKLDKIKDDEEDAHIKREVLHQQFVQANWLDDAVRRVGQIQAVTHSLKPIHPDAKGTNVYRRPRDLQASVLVGSHCLSDDFEGDVVGNAAALDVYKFLKLVYQGDNLLALMVARDVDLAQALTNEPAVAHEWMSSFAGLTEPRGRLTSHSLAKQLYWRVGDDARDDASFHLLAPLYASSLAHTVYQTIQDDRFSDASKAARQAKRDGIFSERPVREYPQMAVQNLGGTKPQNISQLNSERRGDNFLLASLPPVWRSVALKPLMGSASMFQHYARRTEVRKLIKELLAFLKSDPAHNVATRKHRDNLVNDLIDEFLQFTAEIGELQAGWSQVSGCLLAAVEKHWLDPNGVAQACLATGALVPRDTAERVSSAFANWLNDKLRDPLATGDAEFLHWRNLMLEQIRMEERETKDEK